MIVNIGRQKPHTFQDPLGMLSDCHRRIERFLGWLVQVAGEARGNALSDDQRKALEASLRYFQEAAPRHTADEEESLFPRMRACRHPELDRALERLEALHADHLEADRLHVRVETLGRRWLEADKLDPYDLRNLTEAVAALSELYARHIALEDSEVFPLAGRMLEPAELEAVGQEMAARRDAKSPS